ncbi:hypothetical protein B4Q13_23720, partial [Lacticaseibacillus rhamnosus]
RGDFVIAPGGDNVGPIAEDDVKMVRHHGEAQHVDAEHAAQSMFGERIAHGMLVAGLISAVLGTQLPGPNSIYLGQDLKFVAPVMIGDTITASRPARTACSKVCFSASLAFNVRPVGDPRAGAGLGVRGPPVCWRWAWE